MEDCAIEDRVVRYWTIRSRDFGAVRKNELGSVMGRRWQEELEARLPAKTPLNILDVGTGTGFFAILMARLGHRVTGIDLTPAMLEEAAAIAAYLRQFRGMAVDAEQIIIGAGTELLYTLIIQLLGREKRYAVEDPGYGKIARIYQAHQVPLCRVGLDGGGLDVAQLRRQPADVVHISPSHHYPTGIVMPIARRQELLRWAAEQPERYILEDDYDSEFRFVGRPIPTLFSVSESQRVIYLNTFSKTIAPSIRISYMILPPRLLARYREKLGFYACTVSSFEQYTLARFLEQGRYEQHLNRMKTRYRQKRDAVIDAIRHSPLSDRAEILEQDAGLHFLMVLPTDLDDRSLRRRAEAMGLRLALLSDYYSQPAAAPQHILVVNYAGIDMDRLPEGLRRLAQLWEEPSCMTNLSLIHI